MSAPAARRSVPPPDRRKAEPELRRYRDPEFGAMVVKVLPGRHHVTDDRDEMLVTVLGSCVSACIRDPAIGVGGMNHFMLPESSDGAWGDHSASLRYGNFAMEQLINDILKRGGQRFRLEVKLFGGGRVLKNSISVGDRNVAFVESYLKAEDVPVAARDLLGDNARRVHYFPVTGKVFVKHLHSAEASSIAGSEASYSVTLKSQPVAGSVELF